MSDLSLDLSGGLDLSNSDAEGLDVVVSDISSMSVGHRRVRMLRIAAWARMVLVVSLSGDV